MNKQNAFYVRNKSASVQVTVFASSSKEARDIAREITGSHNRSLFRAVPVSNVEGYN